MNEVVFKYRKENKYTIGTQTREGWERWWVEEGISEWIGRTRGFPFRKKLFFFFFKIKSGSYFPKWSHVLMWMVHNNRKVGVAQEVNWKTNEQKQICLPCTYFSSPIGRREWSTRVPAVLFIWYLTNLRNVRYSNKHPPSDSDGLRNRKEPPDFFTSQPVSKRQKCFWTETCSAKFPELTKKTCNWMLFVSNCGSFQKLACVKDHVEEGEEDGGGRLHRHPSVLRSLSSKSFVLRSFVSISAM